MRFQLVENTTMIGRGRVLPTIERIFPLYNREVLNYLEQTKAPGIADKVWKQILKESSVSVTPKQSQRVTSGGHYLYGCPDSADSNRVSHFIYCIIPTVVSRDTMICVLSLLQRKFINRKDTGPRYEYASSLLYMKLPSHDNADFIDSNNDMNDKITSLDTDIKKKIIQLVKDQNRCFKNIYNSTFYEGRLMDRPITLSNDCKAHIAVYQSVTPPHLLTIALQDESNALVSSTACIFATPMLILYIYIRKQYIENYQVRFALGWSVTIKRRNMLN
jgi:hypothetical protein